MLHYNPTQHTPCFRSNTQMIDAVCQTRHVNSKFAAIIGFRNLTNKCITENIPKNTNYRTIEDRSFT